MENLTMEILTGVLFLMAWNLFFMMLWM